MATTTTTSARGTPSSHANAHTYAYTHTQPQSQTTAAVHEFRCLFTHDAHKKKKKWHDGSVRFHTFNRRVMLYDDTNNYVSSLHFRQDDDFDEGVELRLDGGVLVDVGERQGETQTDLAPILDRKKDSSGSPQPARTIRLVAAASQSHPKPLSQILGTQSRLGRARPLPSPYQQRQPLVPAQPAQTSMLPPPKRQKLNTRGKENDNAASTPAVMPTPPLPRLQQSTRPAPQVEEPQKTAPEIMDLSSDEETRRAVTKKQENKPKPPKPLLPPKAPPSPRPQDRTSMSRPLRNGQASSRPAPVYPPETRRDIQQSSMHGPDQSMQTTTPRPGMTWLRLCRNRPRCKITNSALLPSSDGQHHCRARHVLRDPTDVSCQRSAAKASTDVHSTLQPATPHLDLQALPRRGSIDESVQLFSSPMFIPEDTQRRNNSPRPQPSRASTPDSLLADMLGNSNAMLATEVDNAHTSEREQIKSVAPQQPKRDDMSPPPSSRDPFEIGPKHILPPPEASLTTLSMQVSPARQRPFRRVRSANDAEDGSEDALCNFEGFSAPPPSFLAASRPSPVQPRTGVSRSPAKLRRTASDSVAMDPDNETVTSYNIQRLQQEDDETGPWTAIEAYLLFDSWPVGKQKPDYGVPIHSELRTGPGEPTRVSITTAREMLRDEINVL